jgi:membrane protein YqaA with SNARE-associated domain
MDRSNLIKRMSMLVAIAAVLFLVGIFFLKYLKSEIFLWMSTYGYGALFIIVLLVDMLPQPIGPEIAFINGRILELNVWAVMVLALVASTGASFLDYFIGKAFSPQENYQGKRWKKYSGYYHKYGVYALLVSAMGPVPYVPFCWLSGSFNLPLRKFLLFAIVPRAIRILGVAMLFAFLF